MMIISDVTFVDRTRM